MRRLAWQHSRRPARAPGARPPALPPADAARRRFVVNVGSNLCYVVLNTAIMMWYVPFLLRHLGVAAYGMISLANSLVMYAAIVSASLDVSCNRFLAVDLNSGNTEEANRTFNTALALSLGACGVLSLPAGAIAYLFPVLFDVPARLALAAQVLFAAVAVTTLAEILAANFGVASLVTHRFELRNIVRALTSLGRVGTVAVCFVIWRPASLWHVAIGFLASAWIGLIGNMMIWRRLTPQLRIDRDDVDRRQFRALCNLSGWSAVNQAGFLLLMQTDLLVVNAVLGADATGRYGSVLFFPALIYMMTETVVTVLSPAIMARYAVHDAAGVQRIASRSVKLLGIGLALPIGLVCGLSRPLLTLWLGPDFAQLDWVLILLVGHLSVSLAVRPLAYVLTAYNRVKVQGLVTLALGVANLGLAIALARWSGWGMAGVAAAAAIVWTVRNVVFLSGYGATVMGLNWWAFCPRLLPGAIGTLCVAIAGRFLAQLCMLASWIALGTAVAAIAGIYGIVAYATVLQRSDRDLIRGFVGARLHA